MFRGEIGECRHCPRTETMIVNKRRWACKYCNEKLKSLVRTHDTRQKRNQAYYKEKWNSVSDPHRCEECGKLLPRYSAIHISHILSRGAYPQLAYDLRNSNILCWGDHSRWENPIMRKHMKIYPKNLKIIETLKNELKQDGVSAEIS